MDLNADLGEGYPYDEAILDLVTSASIACGAHAGDAATMRTTALAAAARVVAVGAHPSYPDRRNFGRADMVLPADALVASLVAQICEMGEAARAAGTRIVFVKAHGALYNRSAADPAEAEVFAEAVRRAACTLGTGLGVLCPPGSQSERMCRQAGLRTFAEVFADRAYRSDGTLAPRGFPGAVLHDTAEVAAQAVSLAVHGRVATGTGEAIEVRADSICIHGDTPQALAVARAVRVELERAGVELAPFLAPPPPA